MLGPLPTFYRVVVSVCAILSFAGIGAWLGYVTPEALPAGLGTGVGLGLGAVAAMLLLREPPRRPAGHRLRVRDHRSL